MGPTDLFKRALNQASAVIEKVDSHYLDRPTPCDEWDMYNLINHMLYELSWMPDLVSGRTIADVGDVYDGDLLEENYKQQWQNAAARAQIAVDDVKPGETAHLSYGDVPVEHYLTELGTDLIIHSWDVGQGMQTTLLIDGDLVRLLYDEVLPRAEVFEQSGLFGKRIETKPDEARQLKLLAIFGRPSEKWREYTTA